MSDDLKYIKHKLVKMKKKATAYQRTCEVGSSWWHGSKGEQAGLFQAIALIEGFLNGKQKESK